MNIQSTATPAFEEDDTRDTPLGLRAWSSLTSNAGMHGVRGLWLSRGIILSFAVAMFIATWAAWPNLVIDCGREMYVPAAMAHGKRLYRDAWYTYGPLAPFVNAQLFRVFGIGLNTLYFAGFAIFATSALALHSVARRLLPPLVALLCAVLYLATGFGSSLFNQILPYSYSASMGALACMLTLLFLLRYLEHRAGPNLLLAGLFGGLGVLAKFEFFFPVALGVAAAFLLRDRRGRTFGGELGRTLLSALPGVLLAAAVYGWFIHEYGLEFLIHTNWQTAPSSYFMQHYGQHWLQHTGFRFVPREVVRLVGYGALTIGAWAALAFLFGKKGWRVVAGAAVLTLAFLTYASQTILTSLDKPLLHGIKLGPIVRSMTEHLVFPQGMFLLVLAFGIFVVVDCRRNGRPLPAPLLVTIVTGLMLGLRVMMEVTPQGYPIFSSGILFVAFFALMWRLFERVSSRTGAWSRGLALAAYALLFASMTTDLYFDLPWSLIHTPVGDVRRNEQNVALVDKFLPVMQQAKREGKSVLLLPEITGLYFISEMQSASHYEVFVPGVLEPGKYTQAFLEELSRNPPDLIILSNRRTVEYGVPYFGIDYDQEFMRWIERRYHVTGEIGHFERREGAPLSALIYTPLMRD